MKSKITPDLEKKLDALSPREKTRVAVMVKGQRGMYALSDYLHKKGIEVGENDRKYNLDLALIKLTRNQVQEITGLSYVTNIIDAPMQYYGKTHLNCKRRR